MEHQFEQVYREYAGLVRRYLLKIGCDPQDTEDITQDTFVKALLHIDSFRGESSLAVWLCAIARNTWRSMLKKKKQDAEMPRHEIATEDAQFWEWMDLVDTLGEPQRSVFLKRALSGWDYPELAMAYGKSESWARVTYHRARLKLMNMLEGGNKNDAQL